MVVQTSNPTGWPQLVFSEWKDTCAALHRYAQIVGKVRFALTPWVNHSWHATFYVTARGLTTGPIYGSGQTFQFLLDFVDHALVLESNRPATLRRPLEEMSVSRFRERVLGMLDELAIQVHVNDVPNEIPDALPFSQDTQARPYDAAYVERFWRVLLEVDRVFTQFRTGFLGKVSPVHLFWGSFDMAVTRFSGRRAPKHPGGIPALPDEVTREAYSHEVCSAGFWPGDAAHDASFYSYAYPEPEGYRDVRVAPEGAAFEAALGEFVLPYARVREAEDPNAALLQFLQSTYQAAADTGRWPRGELECPLGVPGVPRAV
jgi:hypothetical protein